MGFGDKKESGSCSLVSYCSPVLSLAIFTPESQYFCWLWLEHGRKKLTKRDLLPHSISCSGRFLFTYKYLRNLQQGRLVFYGLVYSWKIPKFVTCCWHLTCVLPLHKKVTSNIYWSLQCAGTILSVLGVFPPLICVNSHQVGTLTLPISWRGTERHREFSWNLPDDEVTRAGIQTPAVWLENLPA